MLKICFNTLIEYGCLKYIYMYYKIADLYALFVFLQQFYKTHLFLFMSNNFEWKRTLHCILKTLKITH